jgi:hypothetical protein
MNIKANTLRETRLFHMNNLLQVVLPEFVIGLKPFRSKRHAPGQVLLAYEGGFLSFESNEVKTVMRAKGCWEGRASFSAEIMRALAMVPPSQNPVTISYAQDHILIAGMTIACSWDSGCDDDIDILVDEALNPSIIDFLAMDRTARRAKVGQSGISQKIRGAKQKMERRIKNAYAQLSDLGITEQEIRSLVEAKIEARIAAEINGSN